MKQVNGIILEEQFNLHQMSFFITLVVPDMPEVSLFFTAPEYKDLNTQKYDTVRDVENDLYRLIWIPLYRTTNEVKTAITSAPLLTEKSREEHLGFAFVEKDFIKTKYGVKQLGSSMLTDVWAMLNTYIEQLNKCLQKPKWRVEVISLDEQKNGEHKTDTHVITDMSVLDEIIERKEIMKKKRKEL